VCLCMYMTVVDMYNKQPKLIPVYTQKKQYYKLAYFSIVNMAFFLELTVSITFYEPL